MIRHHLNHMLPALLGFLLGWMVGTIIEMNDLRQINGRLYVILEGIGKLRDSFK